MKFNESALIDSTTITVENKSLILEILSLNSYSHYDTYSYSGVELPPL